ncbi:MAG: archaellin/type IV pilin N-terminal domain-containing protein [Nitrososphaerota archaeon]|nr:archaellin/type IV pilin N-terminal domain-containing protein [Nitrososphaerota archaeon]
MLVQKMVKSRKAISPILATLLLVVIAVAAIVVTYAWVMTYMSSASRSAGVMLTYDAVSWPDKGTIILYIRNTGTSDAKISVVYIGTSSTNLAKASIKQFDPSDGLVEADGGVVEITIAYDWQPETTYYFRVAPDTGAPLEFSVKSPKAAR